MTSFTRVKLTNRVRLLGKWPKAIKCFYSTEYSYSANQVSVKEVHLSLPFSPKIITAEITLLLPSKRSSLFERLKSLIYLIQSLNAVVLIILVVRIIRVEGHQLWTDLLTFIQMSWLNYRIKFDWFQLLLGEHLLLLLLPVLTHRLSHLFWEEVKDWHLQRIFLQTLNSWMLLKLESKTCRTLGSYSVVRLSKRRSLGCLSWSFFQINPCWREGWKLLWLKKQNEILYRHQTLKTILLLNQILIKTLSWKRSRLEELLWFEQLLLWNSWKDWHITSIQIRPLPESSWRLTDHFVLLKNFLIC